MKKVLAICLMMATLISMTAVVSAEPGAFVSSPSGNPAPIVVSFETDNEDCTAELVITLYGEREELPEDLQALFEKAYNEIINSEDLTKLNEALAKLASDKNIKGTSLAVGELFDIHVTGCDYHEGHTDFDIVLDADTLSHFVGLLHMNQDGVWELVADAEVINNGEHLKFSVESFSPFAIVVNADAEVEGPKTGDNARIYAYSAIMAVSALAIVVIAVKSRKQRA